MAPSLSLEELVNHTDPGWPIVQEWIAKARNPVEVLPAERARAERTLTAIQITTRSPLGAIAYECGGLLVDGGWVRILGSGSERLRGDLASWNGLGDAPLRAAAPGKFIIALDVLGGIFALEARTVWYFAPDSLAWEDLGRGYSDVVGGLLLQGDLGGFYRDSRWEGWQEDVGKLRGDQGVSIYPPLWTKEGKDLTRQSRKPALMTELVALGFDMASQLGGR